MNSLFIDIKYANILSSRLELFKVKKSNPYLANFRCPICGDSESSKFKTRGYILQTKQDLFFKCHNCGKGSSFASLLKKLDTVLYDEYSLEIYKLKLAQPFVPKPDITKIAKPKYIDSPLGKLKKISQLRWDHPAKQYVLSRKIENPWHTKLFYCERFAAWTNSMIPDKLDTKKDSSRIIIPLLNKEGQMFGYQGRSLDPNDKLRYITIMLDDTFKLYGYDTVSYNKTIYVVEGAIDSMFLTNGVAALQGDLLAVKSVLPAERCVFIPDRDVRNKEVMKLAKKIIDDGQRICMLPETFLGKDINEAILNGMCQEEISVMINKNTYRGLEAQMHFSTWSKITT